MYRRRVELRKRVITFVSGIVSSHALSLTENLHRVQKRGETTEKVANEERRFRDTIGIDKAAVPLGLDAFRLEVMKAEDIIPSIEAAKGAADALYVCSDPFLTTQRVRINTLAASARLPTMHAFREHVLAGGLMSYGPNFPDLFRRSGDYVDKILRGSKPADIPVEQPLKFDLVFNNTTAKALGL